MELGENKPEAGIGETLGLLPEPDRRLTSFAQSLVLNVVIGMLLLWLTVSQLHQSPPLRRYVSTELIFPMRLPPAPRVRAPAVHLVSQVRPQPAQPLLPRPNTPAMPSVPSAAPMVVMPLPSKTGLFAVSKPSVSAPLVKAGGFGDPQGIAPHANASRPATVAVLGKFEDALGRDQGAGAAHEGVVTTGGFGSGETQGAGGAGVGHGAVTTGGFGGTGTEVGFAAEVRTEQVKFIPPEVLSEPRPQYTEEAKQLRIQGEITLQVRFGLDGKVQVLRVVTGLGHGLDQEARLVAEQIRFKPAVKNGQPTDHVTYIHILFQLA